MSHLDGHGSQKKIGVVTTMRLMYYLSNAHKMAKNTKFLTPGQLEKYCTRSKRHTIKFKHFLKQGSPYILTVATWLDIACLGIVGAAYVPSNA